MSPDPSDTNRIETGHERSMQTGLPSRIDSNYLNVSQSSVERVELKALPPLAKPIAEMLKNTGVSHFAFFGGAIRDADASARHDEVKQIHDYDIRIWFPSEESTLLTEQLLKKIELATGNKIEIVPSLGTGRPRYVVQYEDSELDISVRTIPEQYQYIELKTETVAQERASDSDIGLCSVALDPDLVAWARPEYISDQEKRTLSVFPINDLERKKAYTHRMSEKFPSYTVKDLFT